jgi:hypothetical protein
MPMCFLNAARGTAHGRQHELVTEPFFFGKTVHVSLGVRCCRFQGYRRTPFPD